ncbi:MAG TPA: tetratricopeptide repeat protein, partial [Acidobacteriota bacterium]|nr:tetratricopeptide repeat protein [Acidobacteriota bacterium]
DLYLKEGDLDKAYTQFEPAMDRQIKRKDPEKAIALLQKILKLDSSFHPALQRLTDIYGSLKQTPNLVTTYNQLVDALISKTLYNEASTALEKLMVLEPDNEQHQEKLDFVHSFIGKQPKSKAPTPAPEPIKPLMPEPEVVEEESTSEDFDISIDLDVQEVEVSISEAEVEPESEAESEPEAELPAVEEDIIVPPAIVEEEIILATEEEISASEEEVVAPLEQVINPLEEITHTSPKRPTPVPKPVPPVAPAPVAVAESPDEERDFVSEHLIEADVFTKYGLIDKAIEQLLMITARYPNSVVAHQKLKEIYLEKGERGKAVEECVTMSKIFRKQSDMDQAEDLLSEARQIDPNHPSLEKAFKEMPATTSSTDVLSEIERLAQSLRKIPSKSKPAAKAKEKVPAPKPKREPVIELKPEIKIEPKIELPQSKIKTAPMSAPAPEPEPEPEIQIEEISNEPIHNALYEKTPIGILDPEKFDEVDFYIDQGLLDEAARLLSQMKNKHPNDAGILTRIWKLKERGIPVPDIVPEEQSKEEVLEELTPVHQMRMNRESPAVSVAESSEIPEPQLPEELLPEISSDDGQVEPTEEVNFAALAEIEEVADTEENEVVESLFEPAIEEEIPDPHDAETPVGTWATLEAMSGINPHDEGAESLFQQSTKQEAGEQTWDVDDLGELSENVMMVPEPEEDSFFDKAMGAAIDLTSGPELEEEEEEEEEEDSIDQRFPHIQETEQTSFDELEPGPSFNEPEEDAEVPYIPVESEVDAALDAAFTGEQPVEEEEDEIEESKPVQASPELFEEEEDYFDLAAELEEGFLNVQSAIEEKPADGQNYSLEEILTDFRKGVEKQLGSEDYDTRYNLGIAYKEMGLIDEAIAEFQIASKDPKRFLECCSMLGLCFVEKGMPKLAAKWYQRGLETGGFTEEEYQGLKYEMAQACELMGELEKALEFYQEVYVVNAGYRNVAKKIKELTDHFRSKERPT